MQPGSTVAIPELRTARLVLRAWRDEDLAPFAALNADPRVREHFPSLLTFEESGIEAARIRTMLGSRGFGLWAVEAPGVASFIGVVGLTVPRFEARFTPCVEIAWRLAFEHWGRGYASEGARAALRLAFEERQLDEVVAMTTPSNVRSQRVMQRIGMTRDPVDDFDHPLVPEGHRLRRHVLYRITRAAWGAAAATRSAITADLPGST